MTRGSDGSLLTARGADRGWSERVCGAGGAHGTAGALRLPRGAERRAEVHQRLVEVEHMADRQDGARDVPEVAPHRMRRRVPGADEDPEEHARDVRVEDRGALAEGE